MHLSFIHRDLRPANIRVGRAGIVPRLSGIIDFEHAGPGDRWLDLSRLTDEVLAGRAEMTAPFWRGYQCGVSDEERALRLDLYRVFRHACAARYAARVGDTMYRAQSVGALHAHYGALAG